MVRVHGPPGGLPAGARAFRFCLTQMVTQTTFFLARDFAPDAFCLRAERRRNIMEQTGRRTHPMLGTILTVVGFLAVWLLLQLVILPKLGVST